MKTACLLRHTTLRCAVQSTRQFREVLNGSASVVWRCYGVGCLVLFTIATLLAQPAWTAKPAGDSQPLAVTVSILDLMRASVEIPADGIWAAQGAEKLGDNDWLLVDEDSVSLAGAATLISTPGAGKNDADWQSWVRDVQATALSIRAAAKAKDSAKLSAAADHLSEICQNCHTKYRPEAPSDGVTRYPFYPKRELAQ